MPAIPTRRMLEHWVCFDCRKMFRKPSRYEGTHTSKQPEIPKHICPQCKKQMRDMGKHFEPPRCSNQRLWEVMKVLSDNGWTFHCEGCKAFINHFIFGNARPNLKVVQERISKLKTVSEGDQLLRKICQKTKSKRPRWLLPDVSGMFITD